jgi:hypothetical protein
MGDAARHHGPVGEPLFPLTTAQSENGEGDPWREHDEAASGAQEVAVDSGPQLRGEGGQLAGLLAVEPQGMPHIRKVCRRHGHG